MSNMHRQCIAEVASSVLESTVFANCEIVQSFPSYEVAGYVMAAIHYAGHRNGILTIITSSKLCSDWSDMLLGSESDSSVHDVLGEIANIIGGNLISRITLPTDQVRLLPPKVCDVEPGHWAKIASDAFAVVLSVDDRPFILHLQHEAR